MTASQREKALARIARLHDLNDRYRPEAWGSFQEELNALADLVKNSAMPPRDFKVLCPVDLREWKPKEGDWVMCPADRQGASGFVPEMMRFIGVPMRVLHHNEKGWIKCDNQYNWRLNWLNPCDPPLIDGTFRGIFKEGDIVYDAMSDLCFRFDGNEQYHYHSRYKRCVPDRAEEEQAGEEPWAPSDRTMRLVLKDLEKKVKEAHETLRSASLALESVKNMIEKQPVP